MPQLVSGRFDPLTDDTLFIRIDHEWFKGQLRWSPHILRGPAAPRTKRTQKEHTYARFFTRHNSTGRYCWERVLAMGILSVCLSVTTRYGFKALWDRDSGSSPCDSLGSVVSYEIIWCHSVKRFPSNVGIKEGTPLRNPYFTIIGSSSVKTVADRHRLVAYHNKHCRRAFQRYQHRWPWTTLNPPNWCPITNVVYSYFAQKQHMSCPVAMCHSLSHRESKLHAACQKAEEKFVDTRVDREAWRFGAYNGLVREVRDTDSASYRNFLRMNDDSFDILLQKVSPLITRQDARMRRAISPAERLAVTLRYLATRKHSVYSLRHWLMITYRALPLKRLVTLTTSRNISYKIVKYIFFPKSYINTKNYVYFWTKIVSQSGHF